MLNAKRHTLNAVLFFALGLTLFAWPFAAGAQGGLVPCGSPGQPACNTCHLITLANNVIDFLVKSIILPLTALGILVAGLTLLTAAGSEDRHKRGIEMLRAIVIGFFVTMVAWVILNTVLGTLVDPNYNFLVKDFPACKDFIYEYPQEQG